MDDPGQLKALLARLAGELGFALVGVAPAGPSAQVQRFREFLRRSYHADMTWLVRDAERRLDARNLLAGATSVICLAAAYGGSTGVSPVPAHTGKTPVVPNPGETPVLPNPGETPVLPHTGETPVLPHTGETPVLPLIARYARGRDYHLVLKARCRKLVAALAAAAPGARTRVCVDTAPVSDRDLAASAGLGWIGRNGCLVNRTWGSYLLLAEIVTDLPVPPDAPVANGCGDCRACVQACPTRAIQDDGLVDSRRCLSYLTIEHRGTIPQELRGLLGTRVFGCDRCQEVCPHNRRAPAGNAELRGPSALAKATLGDILTWRKEDWDALTRGSAGRRATYEMWLRNAALAAGNAGDPGDAGRADGLRRLVVSGPALAAEAARWALGRLGG